MLRIGQQLLDGRQSLAQIVDALDQRTVAAHRPRFRVLDQNLDLLFDRLQFFVELRVIDDGRVGGDLLQHGIQVGQFAAVVVGRIAHQIVAVGTVDAALVTIELVLLAAIAAAPLDVVVARALAGRIALQTLRAAVIAVAWPAAVRGESIMVRCTLVAAQSKHNAIESSHLLDKNAVEVEVVKASEWRERLPGDARLAVALARVLFARRIEAADRITVAVLATVAGHDVVVAILALVTIAPNNVLLAATVAGQLVADGHAVLGLLGARWIARALIAVAVRQGQRIAEIAGQALVAVGAGRVVHAFQALAGGSIAVSDRVRVDVAVAVARLTQLNLAENAGRVAIVAV